MYEDYRTFKMVQVFGRKPGQIVAITSAYDAAMFLLEEWPYESGAKLSMAKAILLRCNVRTGKVLGSFTYADYPPVEMDNAITRAYDKVMPGWRNGANQPKSARDPEADKKILAHLRPMMEAINAQRAKVKRR